ncbi:MAG: hypothetical protein R3F34_12245 [Planctomycetota bacterium]
MWRQRLEDVREANEKLQEQVDGLRAEVEARDAVLERVAEREAPPEPVPDAAVDELRARVVELDEQLAAERAKTAKNAQQVELIRKLRKELDAVKAAPARAADAGGGAELETARREASELRAKVAELEGRLAEAPAASPENASDFFFKLQGENLELKKRIAKLEKGGAVAAPESSGGKRDARTVAELMEARMRITTLETELENLRKAAAAAPSAPKRAAKSAPVADATRPPVPASAPSVAGSSEGVRRLVEVFVESDVEGLTRDLDEAVDHFVVKETVRIVRHTERVVTRVAGDLIQLFQLHTMLPDTTGTYRGLLAQVLQDPSPNSRRGLVEYLDRLGQWLVAAIGAHRKAAVLFALELKNDLTEERLTSETPLPGLAKVPFLARNELWTRAQAYLATLSPDTIDERIDRLAREQAEQILSPKS